MKPPVKIELLFAEWEKDSKLEIELNGPDKELERVPILHAKYLNILSHHNLIVKKLNNDFAKKKCFKTMYYRGDLNNDEDLEKYGIEAFHKKAGRDIREYIDADDELIEIAQKIAVHEEIVEYCKAVIREINSRTYQIRAIIDWQKFTGIK